MIFRFDACELDTGLFELRRGGAVQPLEPQIFELLRHFAANPDRLISRDELFEKIWAGRIVSDSALSSAIKAARQAIGDDGQAQRLIRTVHGRGFRFLAEVEAPDEPPERLSEGNTVAAPPAAAKAGRPALAVLPFENLSGDAEQEHISDGITEDLIALLARYRSLQVTARNSSFSYRDRAKDVRTISRELGVRYLLQGSVRRSNSAIRVTVQLADGESGLSIWSERFDRKLEDIFQLQDEIANLIAAAVQPEIGQAEQARALRRAPANLDAWEWYQRGLRHLYRFEFDELVRAREHFERAIEHDGGFAAAQSALAYAILQEVMYSEPETPDRMLDQALKAAEAGVSLDDHDAFAYFVLGRVRIMFRELEVACLEFERAIGLNPSFAYPYFGLGIALLYQGRFEAALEPFKTAQRLSPRDPHAWAFVHYQAWPLLALGRYEEAVATERAALRSPNAGFWPYIPLIAALGHLGRSDEARKELARLEALQPGYCCTRARRHLMIAVNPIIEDVIEGLRKAGIPD